MKWIHQGNCHLSAPYRIVCNSRGMEVWLRTKDRYGVLAREIPTVEAAKAFAQKHALRKPETPGLVGPHGQVSP